MKLKVLLAILLLVIAVASRFLPHEPNFVPIGAIALFGGVVLNWRLAIWLPVTVMAISDLFIGAYPGMVFTWLGFMLISVFGMSLRRAPMKLKLSLGPLGAGIIFFVVSNFGVWVMGGMYPPTLAGLANCYYMALPFFRTSLLADFTYSVVIFGVYEMALYGARKYAKLKVNA